MAYSKGILLGRIARVSGVEGAVAVKLERVYSEKPENMESVFLEIDGRPVPFFIEYSEYSGADLLRLKFEDYDLPEKVAEFVGCYVYATAISESTPEGDDLTMLIGFTVLTPENIVIGSVTEVIQNPGQFLLNVSTGHNPAVLIPLHEDLIVKTDRKKRQLIMKIPDGLLEIY